ncbi:MAG: hypothetical protein RLZ04_376 [Actinomycetota bacterium]|jgi:hypothetical protein
MIRPRSRRTPGDTPDPRHVAPVDDTHWDTARWVPTAAYPSNEYLSTIYGCGSLDALFVHGADRITCPFPQAPQRKNETRPKGLFTHELTSSAARLTFVDPRVLHGSQSWILRQHVGYYLTERWELTGIPSAEDTPGNRFPTVVEDAAGRLVIVAGHHRAAAALIRGVGLLCRLVSHDDPLGLKADKAVAFAPRILWGTSSRLPHVTASTAAEIIRLVSQKSRVLCESRDEAIKATLWFHPGLDASHFGLLEGDTLPDPTVSLVPGQFSAFQPIVDVVGKYLLCTDCGGLVSPNCHFHDAPDVCSCMPDPPGYDREALMPCTLCQSCRLVVVSGHYRLRTVVCSRCRTMTNTVNRELGVQVFPQGIHSMVNGSGSISTDPERTPDLEAAIDAFAASLTGMFSSVQRWHDWSKDLLVERLRALDIPPRKLIPLDIYLNACTSAGLTAASGFHELIERAATDMPPYAGELRAVRNELLKAPS